MYINSNQLQLKINNKTKQTQNNIQKSLEKLSSGLRINSASDDAAGLAISQKLLALKRGTNQAIRNVQDANSLVQTADSAMQEMSGIVQRIRELTIQAMNGTNTDIHHQPGGMSDADTLLIQNEIDELKKSLNDIVKNTEFNNKKLLTNINPGEYIYESREASKTIALNELQKNNATIYNNVMDSDYLYPIDQTSNLNVVRNPSIQTVPHEPESYNASTVVDHHPRWTADGQSIIFDSTRDNGNYIVPSDGSIDPSVNNSSIPIDQKMYINNGLMRLRYDSSTASLYLEKRYSTSSSYWQNVKTYSYNQNDGTTGFSFSPIEEVGKTSFVYSDNEGNIQKVDVDITNQTAGSSKPIIPTTDTLNVPAINNTITLQNSPDLYRMNTETASFRIQKINDNGSTELVYWDGSETPPEDGYYYTLEGNEITFYGKAIIGNESGDDAQDYYSISYVSDSFQNNFYTLSIPSNAEVYNMHADSEEGAPRSLNIRVGGTVVDKSQLLSERPIDVEGTTGVFVDEENGIIEFYGDLRPSHNQTVEVDYLSDYDGQNEIQSYLIDSNIDTYNLTDSDLSTNRSLRVYVGGEEVAYDETKTNGYTYENGYIKLYGNARPDMFSNESVTYQYVSDSTNTDKEVYGIKLNYHPEIYNLGSDTSPNSIHVYRNGTEEIAYSDVEGYTYNADTNTIELHGLSRPDVNDTYFIEMVVPTNDVSKTDDKVEVQLSRTPENYGNDNPITFKVLVDGSEVSYDSTKQNGYFYNSSTNRIELYGDARPSSGDSSNYDVEVRYVYERSYTNVGNDSYDFQLASNTLNYGDENQSEPRAIRVYQNGVEIPYDETNGYTYDSSSKQLSLHGTFRPDKDDNNYDFDIYTVKSTDLIQNVPSGSYVYKVELNGEEVQQTDDFSGNGYVYSGNQIEIVGDARPDITNSSYNTDLKVYYFDSLAINLDDNMPTDYFHNYCEHETGHGLMDAELDPSSLQMYLNNNLLNEDQYSFSGNRIVLNQNNIALNAGDNVLSVQYNVRQGTGYEPNQFVFQTGANARQNYTVEINSFDNMLRDTNVICVRDLQDATKGLEIIDKAQNFILKELGNIGASENRLEHISSNLEVIKENTTRALSQIQDADMAKESMNLVKFQILGQTQQAMITHVNQSKEQVLQLLK
ncbi:flagellin N-terminal helical domain-containing protein [Ornithinibacillus contaminans]|uniref:flagellin N-terminal helical domain-containing protein n=1 Tax=Ornithinibacillus contaminans TaxID=694055 RepID=UPI00069E1720|nr:flagellin [Ornithinibacillus contaminans]